MMGPNVPYLFGEIDGKVLNSELLSLMSAWMISGPTAADFTPFDWSEWSEWPHMGMPNIWNFEWILYKSPFIGNNNELFEELSY
jgi:hypothetical protein